MVNAHLHSVTDYALDIWAVVSDEKLENLQKMIDRFLLEFHFPSYHKKKMGNVCSSLDSLRLNHDFLSVKQRRDYIILKNMYKMYKTDELAVFPRQSSRKIPLIKLSNFKSTTFKKSVQHRGSILWNNLPKDLKIDDIGYESYKQTIKHHLTVI